MAEGIGVIKLPINRLHMELTNICNFSCEFCPDYRMKRERGMMSLEMAKSIIDEAANTKIAKMVLFHVMGEPTLHPHLIDIVDYASSRSIETCLTTNGSRLEEKLLNELISAGIGKIIISLQTPDERTFVLRGARGITFNEYEEKIVSIAKRFLFETSKTKLTISFLSSPLRKLIIPIFPEVSIADTTSDLKKYLMLWYEKITPLHPPLDKGRNTPLPPLDRGELFPSLKKGTAYRTGRDKGGLSDNHKKVLNDIKKIWKFKENTVNISNQLNFHTRVMGDWSIHFGRKNVNALVGYCPGIQENFGILWNGDYTFCCTDFDGKTSSCNYNNTSITDYLGKEVVQKVVRGFNHFRVVHPYCKQCLGDRNLLNAVVKQIGSVAYFKWMRNHNKTM